MRRVALGLVVVGALVTLILTRWPGGSSDPERTETNARDRQLECEAMVYPCTWPEVSPELATRTDQVGQIAAALLQTLQDPRAVAAVLAESAEFDEIGADEQGIRFRLPGARPAWVTRRHDHSDAGDARAGQVPVVAARPPIRTAPLHAAASTVLQWASVSGAALFPAVHAQDHVAGAPDTYKGALVLAPFYSENRLGRETGTVYELLATVKDIKGGRLLLHANLPPDGPDESDPFDTKIRAAVQGPSTIEQFLDWNTFNFVYLASHGLSVCPDDPEDDFLTRRRQPDAERDQLVQEGKCHTLIWVQEYPGGAEALRKSDRERPYLALPGVDPNYSPGTGARPHPGLSPSEATACLDLVTSDPMATAPGTTKPCLFFPEVPTDVTVSADFFLDRYPGGLDDVIVFLAVCETFRAPDIIAALAPAGNRDVAVFGFRNFVNSYYARRMGTRAVELFVAGFSSQVIKAQLTALAPTVTSSAGEADDFDAVVRSPVAALGGGDGGGVVDESSNPTHARDVVMLIDPLTGEELADGGRIGVVPGAGSSSGDRLVIHPQIIGVAPDDEPPATPLQVRVVGEPVPDESYLPSRRIEPGAFRHVGTAALGRELRSDETVDLEVRVELPGGGESRWTYRRIRLEAIRWQVEVTGGPVDFPTLAGRRARRQMHVVVGLEDGPLPDLGAQPALSIALPLGRSFVEGENTGIVTVRFDGLNYTCAGGGPKEFRLTLDRLTPMQGTFEGPVICTPGRLEDPARARGSLREAFPARATGRFVVP